MPALVALVAFLYASVGHGGASGYLAVLAFTTFDPRAMASTALTLNLLVAGLSWLAFGRRGYFSLRLTAPFLVTSIPAAWLGGYLSLSPRSYALLLALALLLAAVRMALPQRLAREGAPNRAPLGAALLLGAVMGLFSGMIGVGGGIFLSPVLILLGWADVKHTAATSAAFIWLNSLAGVVGRMAAGTYQPGQLVWLVPAAFAGGLVGAYLGAGRFSSLTIRRLLALVLVLAAGKLVLQVL